MNLLIIAIIVIVAYYYGKRVGYQAGSQEVQQYVIEVKKKGE
ncbi:hypothetical protein ABZ714_14250 [Streptomyces sp. NPDC006798]